MWPRARHQPQPAAVIGIAKLSCFSKAVFRPAITRPTTKGPPAAVAKMTTTTTPPRPETRAASGPPSLSPLFPPLLILFLLLLDTGVASASICKAGLCTREQYCCGDGKCCDNVYSLWYLCGGIAVMLFVIGSFCPVIRQFCCFRTPVIVKYVPVPTSPTKFKYADRVDKCSKVDVTLPVPPQATTMDIMNCI